MSRKLLLVLTLIFGVCSFAQDEDPCAEPSDKKVLKLLSEARSAKDPMEAHRKLKASLEEDPGCSKCLFEAGKSAYRLAGQGGKSPEAAKRYLNRLNNQCPEYHFELPYYRGAIFYQLGNKKEAVEEFKRFEEMPYTGSQKQRKAYDKKRSDVSEILSELSFETDFNKNATTLGKPQVLKNVSTRDDEYLPMLSPDNELIFFTRKSMYKAKGDIVPREVERLTQADRSSLENDFNSGLAMERPFNVGDNYGGVSISVNNKEMFICVCKPHTSTYSNCDIYRTHFDLKFNPDLSSQKYVWSSLEPLGPEVNGNYFNGDPSWEAQPSLSGDGQLLFFTRLVVTEDGKQQHDIFYAKRKGRSDWEPAQPLPSFINTDKDEKTPFMHSDSKTLYFSSNGLKGAGGYDIFYSRLNDDGSWTTPKNIGAPINTSKDEVGLIVSTDGRKAYMASNGLQGVGKYDIYTFEIPEEARPDDVLIVKGKINNEDGKAVRDASIEIKYMDTKKVDRIKVDEDDGAYAAIVKLKKGTAVTVTAKKEGHVFDARAFSGDDAGKGGVVSTDMSVQKIKVGKAYRVNDINYETNSSEITRSSEYILENLISFLNENASIKIAIHGHTDNVGQLSDNMELSRNRAGTVMDYLLDNGIKPSRLSAEGFGPNKPIATNATEKGRATNRRTEFVILSL